MGSLQLTIERTAEGYRVSGLANGEVLPLNQALEQVKTVLEGLEPEPRFESLPQPWDTPAMREELAAMAFLDDTALQAIANLMMTRPQQRRYTTLLCREAQGKLTPTQRRELLELGDEFLRISILKSRAYALQQFLLLQTEPQSQFHR